MQLFQWCNNPDCQNIGQPNPGHARLHHILTKIKLKSPQFVSFKFARYFVEVSIKTVCNHCLHAFRFSYA